MYGRRLDLFFVGFVRPSGFVLQVERMSRFVCTQFSSVFFFFYLNDGGGICCSMYVDDVELDVAAQETVAGTASLRTAAAATASAVVALVASLAEQGR